MTSFFELSIAASAFEISITLAMRKQGECFAVRAGLASPTLALIWRNRRLNNSRFA
jgi:hypothetical protein